jgi:hypothetical protein
MAEKKAYAFRSESDLDTAKELIKHYRDYSTVPEVREGEDFKIVFAKVTELRSGTDGKQCKAIDVVYNATTRAFEAPEGTAWIYDSDNIDDDFTTTDLFSSEALEVDEVVEVILYPDSSGAEQWMARKSGGGGAGLTYATSPNTTFDASFTYGATASKPSSTVGDFTALGATALFYLSTPWNTSVLAPDKMFGWWNKVGDEYIMPIDEFYIKPEENYPSGSGLGIDDFTIYLNKKATHSLGTEASFPTGIKAVSDGFDNVNASSNSLSWFNGRIIKASYDSENNIIYMDHPQF